MIKPIAACVASLVLLAGPNELTLTTDYSSGLVLKLDSNTSLTMEVISFELLRDGEPMDTERFGEGGSSEARHMIVVEHVLEATDGVPTKVRREFQEVEGSRTSERRGEVAALCPLDGVTLELRSEDGDVKVEVVDGEEPDDEEVLEGQRFGLLTDALLPEGSVEEGATWELDHEQVLRVLGLDLSEAMFAREPSEWSGGSGGGRGGPRGGGGGSAFGLLKTAEWTATATLETVDEEVDGASCARIVFLFEASGDLPEREWGGGRGRMFEPELARPFESTYEAELSGFLLFDLDSRLPVRLEVEGSLGTERNTVREMGDSTIEIQREEAGTFERTIEFSREESTD